MNGRSDIALTMKLREIPLPGGTRRGSRREVFEGLVREHGSAMQRLAARLTGGGADAEDLLQETFFRAWRGISSFRRGGSSRAWLARILLNIFRDGLRRRLREGPAPAPAVREADPQEESARREMLRRVYAAIDKLPTRQREAMLLRARAGLSYGEIAEAMGIRRGAVKAHLVQARRRLLASLGKSAREWGLR